MASSIAKPTGRLVPETVARRSIDPETLEAMWRLFARYYTDVAREKFESDLAKKQEVILVRDSGDRSLQGFSTIEIYDRKIGRRRFVAVFSGDTIVDEAYWGQAALQRAFFALIMRTKLKNPLRPVYWFLISKGYRTYLLLSRNFVTYYPRHDRETPELEREVISLLSRDKYGEAFDEAAGVLRFPLSEGRLKDGVAPIESGLLDQPDIRFFVQKNPGHARGEELCCLGRVDTILGVSYSLKLATKLASSCAKAARRLWATT